MRIREVTGERGGGHDMVYCSGLGLAAWERRARRAFFSASSFSILSIMLLQSTGVMPRAVQRLPIPMA